MERQLVTGGFYRHFKDKLYQVKATAIHSETKEKLVIYQALYGGYELYVRPYDMFLSEVDHIKYPDVRQKYRFELIDIKTGESMEKFSYNEEKEDVYKPVDSYEKEEEYNAEDGTVNSKLIKFFDAYDYKEKLDVLTSMRSELNDELIDIMAESIEVAVPEGDISDRYNSLRKCLLAHTKYEGLRLR